MKLLGWVIILFSIIFLGISIGGIGQDLPQEGFVLGAFVGIVLGAYLIYKGRGSGKL
ncbi:hypothetical protein [Myroides sp. LoEW2-1]|uniref:hypothetical protein n=1 Tax=Myroides sp. LoEW2-1 TaxID=2683192 RepID=UPI0014120CD7|nr:hypothetical protein [Myroides sp. LoEW2-1]